MFFGNIFSLLISLFIKTNVHKYNSITYLMLTPITHAHSYCTHPPDMYISSIDTMYHRIQTHLDTVYRYHTYELHTPTPTLYLCHTCRHTLTYTHVHPWTQSLTQAWVYKYIHVHTCSRHVSHTHTCTIDIHSTDTQGPDT